MSPLGDSVRQALERVGVTEDRVARWLGRSCGGCKARQQKLNDLHFWAARVLRGRLDRARQFLEGMLEEDS